MNVKTTMTMVIALVAMIGLTGLGSAVTTDVTYTGDGSYDMQFNGDGTGYLGMHTYTGNGEDHLQTTWTNAHASGWQNMDVTNYATSDSDSWNSYCRLHRNEQTDETSGSDTTIDRVVTVGGMGDGANASGSIKTFTNDTNGNTLYTLATYRDDVAWTSHVTTDQIVEIFQNAWEGTYDKFGRLTGWHYVHDEYAGENSGVAGTTDISGFAYGNDVLVSGIIRGDSGDAYTYVLVEMTQGDFDLNAYTDASSGTSSESGWEQRFWLGPIGIDRNYYSSTGGYVDTDTTINTVDAAGIGVFILGAEADDFGGFAHMTDDNGYLYFNIDALSGDDFYAVTPFDGNFDATGYVYAVDI